MKLNNLLIIGAAITTLNSWAVEKPTISPLLGTYKGVCDLVLANGKVKDPTELSIERSGEDGILIKMRSSLQSETPEIVLIPGKEVIEKDDDGNRVSYLLKLNENLRKWELKIKSTDLEKITSTYEAKLDFSNPSSVNVTSKGTFGGQETLKGKCDLDKMNVRVAVEPDAAASSHD